MAEPLSPSDLSAIQAERGSVHMHVDFGLLADRDGGPDVAEAAAGIETALEQLAEAAA